MLLWCMPKSHARDKLASFLFCVRMRPARGGAVPSAYNRPDLSGNRRSGAAPVTVAS